jgi:serine/threonine protein kinase
MTADRESESRTPRSEIPEHLRKQVVAACDRLLADPVNPTADATQHPSGISPEVHQRLLAELNLSDPPGGNHGANSTSLWQDSGSVDRFEIVRPLASGGMGLVSEAIDREFDRPVALKEILPAGANDPAYRLRFQTEAEITARLDHPGIIPVYSRGRLPDGRLFYTMRLISGEQTGTLQQAIRVFHLDQDSAPAGIKTAERDLAWRGLIRRVIAVCHTMAYAHQQGVLHRDLKPSNILLGPCGETLVVDWGLARFMNAPPERGLAGLKSGSTEPLTTQVTVGVGTLGHTAPEQLSGKGSVASESTDIYSLGTILYAVLTGRSPFPAEPHEDPTVVAQRIRTGVFPTPGKVNRLVDPALEAICLKAMAREPAQRYADAGTLAHDLERALADEPVSAWSEPLRRRLRRWLSRHRPLVAAMAIGLLIATLALGWLSLVQSRHRFALKRQAEKLEEQAQHLALALQQSQVAEEKASAAQQRAETERAKAFHNEGLAIQAINRFHQSVVANQELRRNSQLSHLREQLLRDPLPFFQEMRERLLAESNPSVETLARLRDATLDLAQVHREVGDTGEALRLARGAIDLCREVLDIHQEIDEPTARGWRLALGRAHLALGNLFPQAEHLSERMEQYEQAIAQFRALRSQMAGDPRVEGDLANALARYAVVCTNVRRLSEARASLEETLATLQPLYDQNPGNKVLRDQLASSLDLYAFVLNELGDEAGAERQSQRVEQIRGAAGEQDTIDLDVLMHQATSLLNKGVSHARRKQHPEAVEKFRKAVQLWRQVCGMAPGQNEFEDGLRYSQLNLIEQLNLLQQHQDCLPVYEDLVERQRDTIRRNPGVDKLRGTQVQILHNFGHLLLQLRQSAEARDKFAEALELAEALLLTQPQEPMWRGEQIDLRVHLSEFDLETDALEPALVRLLEVLPLARTAAGSPTATQFDHQILRHLLNTLAKIHEQRDEPTQAVAYRLEILRDAQADPTLKPLVAMFQQFRLGALPDTALACLQRADQALALWDVELAHRLYRAALELDPGLVHDRQLQPGYQLARASLIWARQQAESASETAVNLRNDALSRLQFELQQWQQVAQQDPAAAAAAMQSWFRDAALDSVRQPARRATLPAAEQPPWEALFEAAQQLAKPSLPGPLPPATPDPVPAAAEATDTRANSATEGGSIPK